MGSHLISASKEGSETMEFPCLLVLFAASKVQRYTNPLRESTRTSSCKM